MLALPDVPRNADDDAINEYLSWGYIPAPHTGFRGVSKLEPAHHLTIRLADRQPSVEVHRYWQLDYLPKLAMSEADACALLRDQLEEAVRLRLVSDVPLGAFLSGGIDSSIVVGIMARLSSAPINTFTIGFAEHRFDESQHAARIARRWGTNHHAEVVKPDALSILPRLVRHYGEPYADSSAIPTFYVSQVARRQVTVALNGDGGDESFAGYERYRANRAATLLGRLPGALPAMRTASKAIPQGLGPRSRLGRRRRFSNYAGAPEDVRYAHWVGYFDDSMKTWLCTPEFLATRSSRPEEWMAELFRPRTLTTGPNRDVGRRPLLPTLRPAG